MNARMPPMQDAALIEALNQATSLKLYQLSALLERLITDPRRIVAVRVIFRHIRASSFSAYWSQWISAVMEPLRFRHIGAT